MYLIAVYYKTKYIPCTKIYTPKNIYFGKESAGYNTKSIKKRPIFIRFGIYNIKKSFYGSILKRKSKTNTGLRSSILRIKSNKNIGNIYK